MARFSDATNLFFDQAAKCCMKVLNLSQGETQAAKNTALFFLALTYIIQVNDIDFSLRRRFFDLGL